jgi:transporter family-2 protein
VNPAAVALVVMLVGGAMLSLQAPTNAFLGRAVGSPVNAALVSFVVGTLGLAVAALTLRARPDVVAARSLPWWAWLGGLYGAFLVAATAYAAPRIGLASALTVMIAAQLAAALTLDHFGLLGLPARPVDAVKIAGVALVAAGVVLVRKG